MYYYKYTKAKMADESYPQVKAQNLTKERFEAQANEYLEAMEQYKKTEKKMKQYEVNIKEYMVQNDVREYKNEVGSFTIVTKKVSMLNRALIEDIEQYYTETKRITMYKSLH